MTAPDKRSIASSVSDESREFQGARELIPYVGLFYVVHGKLYWEGVPTEQGKGTAYFKAYPMKHSMYWKQNLVVRFPELGGYDPSYFPRGSVVYDRRNGIYELMTDDCILEDPGMLKKIISEMWLTESKVVTSKDINFQCEACRIKINVQTHMSNEDRAFESMVEVAQDGRKFIFPWGKHHSGYVIPSDKEHKKLRKKWVFMCIVLSSALLSLLRVFVDHYAQVSNIWLGLLLLCLFMIVMVSLYYGIKWWLIRDLEKTDERR